MKPPPEARRLMRLADKAARYLRRHLSDDAQVTIILVEHGHAVHAIAEDQCPGCEAKKLRVLAGNIERGIAESN